MLESCYSVDMGNRFYTTLGVSLVLVAGALILQNGWSGSSVESENQNPMSDKICAQVITRARNPATSEEQDFPTPCHVPEGWQVVEPHQLDEENSALRIGENAIFVSDQKPGDNLKVALAALGADGFVAIHEDMSGKPGKVIGYSILLSKGEHRNFEVALDRPSRDRETLHATLREDDGDKTFSPQEDKPLKDFQGNDIIGQFKIDVNTEVLGDIAI